MRLTMKAIIRWEQLNKKPFSQLDYSSEDEIISLFYVCDQSTEIKVSLDEFREGLQEQEAKKMVKDFERQTFLASQFQSVSKKKSKEAKASEDSNPIYIKEIVPMLVMSGLDVYFALNEMELCDLPIFLQAYDQKVKDKLTAQRLWTFMQLSPHLEKGTTPKDIHPFSWEMEEERISEEDMEKGKNEFATFLKTGLTV
jgi:hypothetical protein